MEFLAREGFSILPESRSARNPEISRNSHPLNPSFPTISPTKPPRGGTTILLSTNQLPGEIFRASRACGIVSLLPFSILQFRFSSSISAYTSPVPSSCIPEVGSLCLRFLRFLRFLRTFIFRSAFLSPKTLSPNPQNPRTPHGHVFGRAGPWVRPRR